MHHGLCDRCNDNDGGCDREDGTYPKSPINKAQVKVTIQPLRPGRGEKPHATFLCWSCASYIVEELATNALYNAGLRDNYYRRSERVEEII